MQAKMKGNAGLRGPIAYCSQQNSEFVVDFASKKVPQVSKRSCKTN